jgi:hypothetical protein
MRFRSPAVEWAMEERRRLIEEISALPSGRDVQGSVALAYLRTRLAKIDALITELEQDGRAG